MKSAPAFGPILLSFLGRALSIRRVFVAVVGVAILVGVLGVNGCAYRGSLGGPHITRDVDMPDIPVPFEFRRLSSWSYDEFDFRSWQGSYTGKMKLPVAADFYHDQMPKEGWLLLSSYPGATRRVLIFSKGTEEQAIVDIRRKFDYETRQTLTVVAVEIKPTSPDALAVDTVLAERGKSDGGRSYDELSEGEPVTQDPILSDGVLDDPINPEAIPASQDEADDAPSGRLIERSSLRR